MRRIVLGLIAVASWPSGVAPACTLCAGNFRTRLSLRQEMAKAQLVVVGSARNARLLNDDGAGLTDIWVHQVIWGTSKELPAKIVIERYLSETEIPGKQAIFFFRHLDHRWELLAWRSCSSDRMVRYLNDLASRRDQPEKTLFAFFADHLDDADADVAADAFLELTRAPDTEVAAIARQISPNRLRRLLLDARTPNENRGFLALLLACVGEASDVQTIKKLLSQTPADQQGNRRGLLAAYVVLNPREGWPMVLHYLTDDRSTFLDRHTALAVVIFFKNWQRQINRQQILQGFRAAVSDADLADLAIEELRRSRWWDLTEVILHQYDQPTHDLPLIRRAIIRYAAQCPAPPARQFLAKLQRTAPDLVREILDTLREEEPNH